jgi:hypothetical protein
MVGIQRLNLFLKITVKVPRQAPVVNPGGHPG